MNKNIIKDITYSGIIAALYVAITFLSIPISFGQIQFRIAEILIILCFFNKKHSYGIILGTLLSNVFSTLGPWDILFGTFATILATLFVSFSKHLIVAIIWPILFNSLIIGLELYLVLGMGPIELYFIHAAYVFLGEFVVLAVGYILFMIIRKRKDFASIINATQNIDFKF